MSKSIPDKYLIYYAVYNALLFSVKIEHIFKIGIILEGVDFISSTNFKTEKERKEKKQEKYHMAIR